MLTEYDKEETEQSARTIEVNFVQHQVDMWTEVKVAHVTGVTHVYRFEEDSDANKHICAEPGDYYILDHRTDYEPSLYVSRFRTKY